MKLYHVPGSRSCRVRWLLEELGIEYTLESLSITDGSLRTDAYRAINPLGRVPTYEDDGVAFYESGAILQYLLERHGDGRLEPAILSPSRARYLQWFHWGEATLMPPIVTMNSHRFVLREEDRSEKAIDVARRQLARILGVLADAVDGQSYLVDGSFSAADIVVGYGLALAQLVGELPADGGPVESYLAGLAARPAYQTSFAGGFGG